ncbi:MAG: hypothetical protein LBS77_07295 [Desulfovibrio sp.]|jgi:hypothetical protein|nr:hypothetical protein [Desulfovibrio sp.]
MLAGMAAVASWVDCAITIDADLQRFYAILRNTPYFFDVAKAGSLSLIFQYRSKVTLP